MKFLDYLKNLFSKKEKEKECCSEKCCPVEEVKEEVCDINDCKYVPEENVELLCDITSSAPLETKEITEEKVEEAQEPLKKEPKKVKAKPAKKTAKKSSK